MSNDVKGLEIMFERSRRGVTDPQRHAAIELQNIATALLEILKELRSGKTPPQP